MTEILNSKKTRNENSLKCRLKVGRLKSAQLCVEKAVIELQKERNKLVCWLIHAGHFLFDFDCGSKCLPTPFPGPSFLSEYN